MFCFADWLKIHGKYVRWIISFYIFYVCYYLTTVARNIWAWIPPSTQHWHSISARREAEKGRRRITSCAAEIKMGLLKTFHPLSALTPDSLPPTISKIHLPRYPVTWKSTNGQKVIFLELREFRQREKKKKTSKTPLQRQKTWKRRRRSSSDKRSFSGLILFL